MLQEMTRSRLPTIRNPELRAYVRTYVEIYEEYLEAVGGAGLELAPPADAEALAARRRRLLAKGAVERNNGHSLVVNRLSPACDACRHGMGSATFYTSLQCHRRCFYCFNPNQAEYPDHSRAERDVAAELEGLAEQGFRLGYVALTGGEPLLHPDAAVGFFRRARERFPMAHARLYTAGDHLDREILGELGRAGLQEIRISVRAEDGPQGRRHTYDRIALAREYIPAVMVETPVLPGTGEAMREMLQELERLGVFGVNLLEFCFPLHNAAAFRQRGYQVRNPPYQTLYDYWYAGGLPIAGSEAECLDLLEYMLDAGMALGGHYCSLENKHTGQICQQNAGADLPPHAAASDRDFFIKTAKVFGDDRPRVRKALERAGCRTFSEDRERRYLEFHPGRMADLRHLDLEVGLCTHVTEQREDGPVLRELKVAVTTPQRFDPATDL